MAGASKFGGTENGADCSKCGGTVAVLFKTRNGTSLLVMHKHRTMLSDTVEAGAKIRWPLFHLNYTAFFLGLTLSEIRSESEQSDILTR